MRAKPAPDPIGGVAVVVVNAKDRASVAALEPWLGEGRSVVLVGKLRAPANRRRQHPARHREDENRRRAFIRRSRPPHHHPSRAGRAAPRLRGGIGRVPIDTPGMRELKPTGEENVAEGGFADIEAWPRSVSSATAGNRRNRLPCRARRWSAANSTPAVSPTSLKLRDEVAAASDQAEQAVATRRLAQSGGCGKPRH